MSIKKILPFFIFIFLRSAAHAQSLTGTWQGEITDDNEFLQINIIQTGDKLCGYTWDYLFSNPRNHCKAYFTGTRNKTNGSWFLDGTTFIENSGSHVLMQVLFTEGYENHKRSLTGFCRIKPDVSFGLSDPSAIKLYKTSNKPTTITETMINCVAENKAKEKLSPAPKPAAVKPRRVPPQKPAPASPPAPSPVRDNVADVPAPEKIIVPQQTPPPLITAGRQNKEMQQIIIHQKKIRLFIYDNGEVDGDSISVYYNGRLLISHTRLTEKAITLDVNLDENVATHSIILYAENLGTIPPNTALIIFTDKSGKRYELHSSATLNENAELIFQYKPE